MGRYVPLIEGRGNYLDSPGSPRTLTLSSTEVSKEHEVSDWLDAASDVEVFEMLGKVAAKRPGLLLRAAALEQSMVSGPRAAKGPGKILGGDQPVPSPRNDTRAIEKQVKRYESVPLIQFSAYVYIADEEDGVVHLDVIRLGDQSKPSSVSWRTKDGAGKAGEIYEETHGTAYFESGDGMQQISVKLLAKDTWSSILDFQVELLPDDTVNAKLGHYGRTTRVKVLDKDRFPSNELPISNILDSSTEVKANLPLGTLVRTFCWLNFTCNSRVRQGTMKRMVLDTCRNLYKLMQLFLRVYLLDKILSTEVEESSLWFVQDRHQSLYLFMTLSIVPFGLIYCFEYLSLTWGINSTTITWIQSALLRRYLNYSSAALSVTDPAVIRVAISRDAELLAKDCYGNVLRLFAEFGNLAVLGLFQITAARVFGKPFRPLSVSMIFVMPLALFCFLWLRMGKTKKVLAEESQAEAKNVSEVNHAVSNFRLISDYSKRGAVVDGFEAHVKEFRAATRAVGQLIFNNRGFCKWVAEVVITFWIGFGGLQVILGQLSLGLFLCDIQTFQHMEEITSQIYDIFVELQTIAPAMDRVVELLNMPTDLHERKAMQNHLREATAYLRQRVQKRRMDDVRMDLLPITLENPSVTYTMRSHGAGLSAMQVNCLGKIIIEQGTYIALVGQVNGGKATRLRTLGGALLPDNLASLFIPSHLRVLHVEREPKFVPGTLMENLCFGVPANDPDGSEDRVRMICSMLELPEALTRLIGKDEVYDWDRTCSLSEKQKVSLARAVISNPDVLIIHRPFDSFDKRSVQKITELLKDFVKYRGVAQDNLQYRSRRPRTCIVSSITPAGVEEADKIYRVTKSGADVVDFHIAHETLQQDHVFLGHELSDVGWGMG